MAKKKKYIIYTKDESSLEKDIDCSVIDRIDEINDSRVLRQLLCDLRYNAILQTGSKDALSQTNNYMKVVKRRMAQIKLEKDKGKGR